MDQKKDHFFRRVVRFTVLVGSSVTFMVSPVAAQGMGGGWEPTAGHLARTVTHLLGIVGGMTIIYFTDRIRRQTRGSALETTSRYVIVGTALFVLVFLGMEANHLLGIDLWYFAEGMALTRTWFMIVLATMILLYTLAFRTLIKEVGT